MPDRQKFPHIRDRRDHSLRAPLRLPPYSLNSAGNIRYNQNDRTVGANPTQRTRFAAYNHMHFQWAARGRTPTPPILPNRQKPAKRQTSFKPQCRRDEVMRRRDVPNCAGGMDISQGISLVRKLVLRISHYTKKIDNRVPLLRRSSAEHNPLPQHCLFQAVAHYQPVEKVGFGSLGATAGLSSSVFPGVFPMHCWASQQWHPFSTDCYGEKCRPAWAFRLSSAVRQSGIDRWKPIRHPISEIQYPRPAGRWARRSIGSPTSAGC